MAEVARRRGIDVETAKFEDWDPEGRTFDAVVSAQTWHWIDPAAGAAGSAQAGSDGEPEQWRFGWERTYTTAEWLDQLPPSGGYTRLAPEQIERILTRTGAAVDAMGGQFTMQYAAMVCTAVKHSGTGPMTGA